MNVYIPSVHNFLKILCQPSLIRERLLQLAQKSFQGIEISFQKRLLGFQQQK